MSIIGIILVLAFFGVLVWLLTTFIPMPAQFVQLIVAVAIIISLLFVLQQLGLIGSLGLHLK